eukprot:12888_1
MSFQSAMFVLCLPCFVFSIAILKYIPRTNIQINNEQRSRFPTIKSYATTCCNFMRNRRQSGLILAVFIAGIFIEMFDICLSAWYKTVFNLNASQFWVVIFVDATARIFGFLFSISLHRIPCYNVEEKERNGAMLYLIGHFGDLTVVVCILAIGAEHVPYVMALASIFLFAFSSGINAIAGNLLSVNLVENKAEKSNLNASMKSSHALGMMLGSFCAPTIFIVYGFERVMWLGLIVTIFSLGSAFMIKSY